MKVFNKVWGKEVVFGSGLRIYWNQAKKTMTVDRSCVKEEWRRDPKIVKIAEKYGHGKVVVNDIDDGRLQGIIVYFNS